VQGVVEVGITHYFDQQLAEEWPPTVKVVEVDIQGLWPTENNIKQTLL
jgi:hypothetical protein